MEDSPELKQGKGMKPNIYLMVFVVILAGLIGCASFYITAYFQTGPELEKEMRLNVDSYSFINPLIGYTDNGRGPLLADDISLLKEKINSITNQQRDAGIINHGSVYYRDLNNGPWFLAGDIDANYKPASLFKVPLMIAYFKVAETDPSILEKIVTYDREFDNPVIQNVDSSNKEIELGKSYSILELIENMIIYSDNLAAYLLIEHIDDQVVLDVFRDLGVPSPADITYNEKTGPRIYASFSRTLYNATYINREYSEKALEILSRTSFKHGMRSVLHEDVKASIKFGIGVTDNGEKQLHECGIIYWQKERPILLCIMTTGNTFEVMSKYLKDVTSVVQEATLGQ